MGGFRIGIKLRGLSNFKLGEMVRSLWLLFDLQKNGEGPGKVNGS